MRAYRIVKREWAASAMDGEGARRFGGRWNPRGLGMVYLADSRALAALEVLVHLNRLARRLPMVILAVDLPDLSVESLDPEDLPTGWNHPASGERLRSHGASELQRLGAAWIRSRKSLALRVPSAIVPEEDNILINPAHPEAARIQVGPPVPWRIDTRL